MKILLQFLSRNFEGRFQMIRNRGGLHNSIRHTLICSRFMGLFPLSGLSHFNSDKLRYTFHSPYTIIYVISMFGQFLLCFLSIFWLLQKGISLTHFSNTLFYVSSLTSSLLLMNIGRSWPKVILKVETIEESLPPFTRNVARLCNATMVFVLFGAMVEHLLSVNYGVIVARACYPDNVTQTYFRYGAPWIFDYTNFALWKGVFIEVFNLQSTFIWSFNDLLIMVISILTEHFIIHNDLLKVAVLEKNFSAATFRLQYLKIAELVRLVNGQIGIYILTSFGSNMYWICTQMLNSLTKGRTGHFIGCNEEKLKVNDAIFDGIEHKVYFIFSCLYLITRTLMVLLLAARIHSNANAPLIVLYGLPSEKFDIEVERYIAQINNIKVALSGLDFFYVTKTMILTLIGTIVTYELVLLQFNK